MKEKRSQLDWITLILSVLAGAIWMFLGGALVKLMLGKVWTPLVLAVYFGGLALVLILVAWLCTMARGFTMAPKKYYGLAALAALGIFVLSGLFQLIYSSTIRIKTAERSAYIFMIDDSGSISDPQHLREEAVRQVMANCDPDYPFAVYSFTDQCKLLQDIQPASAAATMQLDLPCSGLTDVVKALRYVEDDIRSGRLRAGNAPRIILMTDGVFSDNGLRGVLSDALAMNITICTIGVDGSDPGVLQLIADLTNGKFVSVHNLDQLPGAMQMAAIGESNFIRTLISVREPVSMDWLFSLMRIVFLLILGAMFIAIKALLLRSDDIEANMLVPNLIAVLVGALCVEVGMNILYLDERWMQMVMCVGFTILLTVVLLHAPNDKGAGVNGGWGGEDDYGAAGGRDAWIGGGGKTRPGKGGANGGNDWGDNNGGNDWSSADDYSSSASGSDYWG